MFSKSSDLTIDQQWRRYMLQGLEPERLARLGYVAADDPPGMIVPATESPSTVECASSSELASSPTVELALRPESTSRNSLDQVDAAGAVSTAEACETDPPGSVSELPPDADEAGRRGTS